MNNDAKTIIELLQVYQKILPHMGREPQTAARIWDRMKMAESILQKKDNALLDAFRQRYPGIENQDEETIMGSPQETEKIVR